MTTATEGLVVSRTTAADAYLRLLAEALYATRTFTLDPALRDRRVQAFDGVVDLYQLSDLFEGVTHALISVGGGEVAAGEAVAHIRSLATRNDELSAWVESVLDRYGYNVDPV